MGGFVNVEGRVLFWDESLGLALLRFGEHGHIPPHAGPNNTRVCCLEGSGYTKVGDETAPLEAGQIVIWPADIPHDLWTEDSTMTTLMVERPADGNTELDG